MATTTYSTQKLDTLQVAATDTAPACIDYTVRFTNTANPSDTFDAHIQADGSDLDFQNGCRKFLETKFPAPVSDASNQSHQFEVGGQTINVVA